MIRPQMPFFNLTLLFESCRVRDAFLADLAMRGLAISFSTRASVALSDSSLGFLTALVSTLSM
jgi:hypothetical protein